MPNSAAKSLAPRSSRSSARRAPVCLRWPCDSPRSPSWPLQQNILVLEDVWVHPASDHILVRLDRVSPGQSGCEECSIVAAGGVQIGNQPGPRPSRSMSPRQVLRLPQVGPVFACWDLPSACFNPFLLRGLSGQDTSRPRGRTLPFAARHPTKHHALAPP